MTEPAQSKMTPDEFLAWESEQPERHVYFRGEVFAMAGGSPRHSHLAGNISGMLHRQLGAACWIITPDLKLALDADHFGYADSGVMCGPVVLRPGSKDVVTNPEIVIEILSKGTEGYDRGEKQASYFAMPLLRHLVFVSQHAPRVEIYTKIESKEFGLRLYGPGETAMLQTTCDNLSIDVDLLYSQAFDIPGDDG